MRARRYTVDGATRNAAATSATVRSGRIFLMVGMRPSCAVRTPSAVSDSSGNRLHRIPALRVTVRVRPRPTLPLRPRSNPTLRGRCAQLVRDVDQTPSGGSQRNGRDVDNSARGIVFPPGTSDAAKEQALRILDEMIAAKSQPAPPPLDPTKMRLVDSRGTVLKPRRLRLSQRQQLDRWARGQGPTPDWMVTSNRVVARPCQARTPRRRRRSTIARRARAPGRLADGEPHPPARRGRR